MGITGLIPFLEKASRPIHIRDLTNSTVAIDTYCWLHRGAVACAEKLMRGEKTDMHIQYCMRQLQALIAYDIKPILVFDGRHLPAKRGVEEERRQSRKDARKKATELIAQGRGNEARTYIQRAIDITHEMALELIKECRKRNIDCIVAPYEADGQLAFLNLSGIAQYVITEDSDLVLFGCDKVIFKFNMTEGLLVESNKIFLAMGCREEKFTFDKFRAMCILSGCDYLKSLPGIGLAKAKKFFLLTEETDMKRALGKVPSYLNLPKVVVTEEYKQNFLKAIATFRHMVVFDPRTRSLRRLHEPADDFDTSLLENAGEFFDTTTAYQLALGNINPMTMKQVDIWDPDTAVAAPPTTKTSKHISIWGPRNGQPQQNKENKENNVENVDMNQIKRILFASHAANDDCGEKIIEDEVLKLYDDEAPQPTKKRKTTEEEFTEKPHRNPFKVSKKPTSSPEKLNETTSLIGKASETTCSLFTSHEKTPDEIQRAAALDKMRERLGITLRHEILTPPPPPSTTPEDEGEILLTSSPAIQLNRTFSNESGTSAISLSDSLVEKMQPEVVIEISDSPIKLKNTPPKRIRSASRPSGLSKKAIVKRKSPKKQQTLNWFGFSKSKF